MIVVIAGLSVAAVGTVAAAIYFGLTSGTGTSSGAKATGASKPLLASATSRSVEAVVRHDATVTFDTLSVSSNAK